MNAIKINSFAFILFATMTMHGIAPFAVYIQIVNNSASNDVDAQKMAAYTFKLIKFPNAQKEQENKDRFQKAFGKSVDSISVGGAPDISQLNKKFKDAIEGKDNQGLTKVFAEQLFTPGYAGGDVIESIGSSLGKQEATKAVDGAYLSMKATLNSIKGVASKPII